MQDIKVVIAEDDQYSCDLMSFLLTRDRRVRVVAEGLDAIHQLEEGSTDVVEADVILLDTELPWDEGWALTLIQRLRPQRVQTKMVCTGTAADEDVLKEIIAAQGNGYILKDEVHYALGETVVMADAGAWVTTPSVRALAHRRQIGLPSSHVVINGTRRMERLEGNDLTIARLCILFNQPYKDVADELGVGPGHIADKVTEIYKKLGLNDILEGRIAPETYFDDAEILALFENAIAKRRENPRSRPDLKTLAFHLLTLPQLKEPD